MDTVFYLLPTKSAAERLNIKLTLSHKRALIELASMESESMSVVVRNLIKEAAIIKGVWQLDVEMRGGDFIESS